MVLRLLHPGARKIGVIKVVRELTGRGLKDSKELVEGAPSILQEWSAAEGREAAEEMARQLRAVGATVELSP